jgi:hypothetical protein
MGATRAYRRDSHGKFAGSGGGTHTTFGKAGGFANAAFRARTSATNQKASPRRSFGIGQRLIGRPNSMQRRRFTTGVLKAGLATGGIAAAGYIGSGGAGRKLSGADKSLAIAAKAAGLASGNRSANFKMASRVNAPRRLTTSGLTGRSR